MCTLAAEERCYWRRRGSLYTHYGDYAKVFAGIFEMAAVVLVVNVVVERVQRHAIKWKAD